MGCRKLSYHPEHYEPPLRVVRNEEEFPIECASTYSYSFQGQEIVDEVKGGGNSYNYKYRMHDPRLGRFFAVDPLTGKYPHYSPYQFSGNKLIHALELEGLEEYLLNKFGEQGPYNDNIKTLGNFDYGVYLEKQNAVRTTQEQNNYLLNTVYSKTQNYKETVEKYQTGKANLLDVQMAKWEVQEAEADWNNFAGKTYHSGQQDAVSQMPIGTRFEQDMRASLEKGLEVMGYIEGGYAFYKGGLSLLNLGVRNADEVLEVSTGLYNTGKNTPDFIVDPGGQTFPVPKGASGPYPNLNAKGKVTGSYFQGGAGGANNQVSTMRIMDPTPPRGKSPGSPNGYIKYTNKSNQGVNPRSGATGSRGATHYNLKSE